MLRPCSCAVSVLGITILSSRLATRSSSVRFNLGERVRELDPFLLVFLRLNRGRRIGIEAANLGQERRRNRRSGPGLLRQPFDELRVGSVDERVLARLYRSAGVKVAIGYGESRTPGRIDQRPIVLDGPLEAIEEPSLGLRRGWFESERPEWTESRHDSKQKCQELVPECRPLVFGAPCL